MSISLIDLDSRLDNIGGGIQNGDDVSFQNIDISGILNVTSQNNIIGQLNFKNSYISNTGFSDVTNNYGIRIRSNGKLTLNSNSTGDIQFRHENTNSMTINSSGNVGIGTTSPSEKLDVDGNITMNGKLNNVYINSGTTNFTDSLCITDHNFSSINFGSNTNGSTIIGVLACESLISGANNSAYGFRCLQNITTGASNVGVGMKAGNTLTTESYNIAIGESALLLIQGDRNIGLGTGSGRDNRSGCSRNIYIGVDCQNTNSTRTNITNEIVIGADATGNGTDTVTIGNSSITDNYFNGKMVINYNTTNGIGLDVGNNSDISIIGGRAYMGYVGYSDYAAFGHIDRRSSGNYALLQDTNGKTILNSSSGQKIYFRINNTNDAWYDGSSFRVRDKLEMIYRGQTSSDFTFEDGLVIFGTNSSYVSNPYTNGLFATTNTTTKCMFRAGTVRRSNGSEGQIACSSALTFWAGSTITTFSVGDIWFYPPSGYNVRTNRSFIGSSDDRLKFNETQVSNGLSIINQLNVVKYDKVGNLDETPDSSNTTVEIGLIAQEVELIPELNCAVTKPNNDKDVYGLNYDMIHSYHIKATQELDSIVQNQQTTINNQENTINELNTKIQNLENENFLIKSALNELLSEAGKSTI